MEIIRFGKKRIIAFNDAVFSIAITLLILEIDIPSFEEVKNVGTWHVLGNLIPSFIGLFVSFMVIALYWQSHLKFSKFIRYYDKQLLWLNIFLLLFVVLLPFSTAFYVNITNLNIPGPFVFYSLNVSILGFIDYLIIKKVIRSSTKKINRYHAQWMQYRALIVVGIFLLSIIFEFLIPLISRFIFVLIFVFHAIGDRYYEKKIQNSLH